MTKAPFLGFLKSATEVSDALEKFRADYEADLSRHESENLIGPIHDSPQSGFLHTLDLEITDIFHQVFVSSRNSYPRYQNIVFIIPRNTFTSRLTELTSQLTALIEMCSQKLILMIVEEVEHWYVSRRRVVYDTVVSATILLSFVYLYLIGFIDRGGSKAGSSGSLDFRDIYISIVLFQAAYVWIKFRDVIPRGAVYYRPNSNKYEPRIKFPVTRGVGGKSKRIPLGLYDTLDEGEVAYHIAAFYCNKPKHTGQLDLGGGASFPIPTMSMDPNLPYEEKVKQVGFQVLKVYAEFDEQKASRNLPPSIPGRESSPIQQLHNSGMDLVMQGQGSELHPNTHNRVDLNNQGCLLLLHAQTQHALLDAYQQIDCLKSQVSETEFKNLEWEVKFSNLDMKYSELERKFSELEQKSSELERENQLLKHQIKQPQLPTFHEEQEFDTNRFLCMENEESLAR